MNAERIKRQARLDVLSGVVGATICTTFVLSSFISPNVMPIPKEQVAGMIFTCLLCPLVYTGFPEFYLKRRTLLVLLVRMAFAFGTVHDYHDTPHEALSWIGFLVRLTYSSRALVMAWGCFGWQLPFPIHAAVQAIHVAAASRVLVPAICQAPASRTSAGTFMSLNINKFRTGMVLLDWPFAVVLPLASKELNAATSDYAACTAVVIWAQIVLGWMIPTVLLVNSLRSAARPWRGAGEEQGWLWAGGIAQGLWCLLRIAVVKYYGMLSKV